MFGEPGADERCKDLGPIAMRSVSAAREQQPVDIALCKRCDARDLLEGAVLVITPLHGKDRGFDARDVLLDIPVTKIPVQPYIVPAEKRPFAVSMVPPKTLAKRGVPSISFPDRSDCRDRFRLDEEMRRLKNQAGTAIRKRTGEDRGDRGAVAVPEEPRAFDPQPVENLRKHFERLVVHVGRATRFLQFARKAVPEARIRERSIRSSMTDAFREIAPKSQRAQTFMQKDQCRRVLARTTTIDIFDLAAVESQRLCFRVHRATVRPGAASILAARPRARLDVR